MATSTIDRIQRVAEGQRALDKLRAEPERIAGLLRRFRADIITANTGEVSVTPGTESEVRRQRAMTARSEAGDLLDAYRSLAETQRDNAVKAFTAVVDEQPSDNAERLVNLLERQDAWKRIERRHRMPLAVETVGQIAQEAADRGDRATLAALRIEVTDAIALPGYDGMPRPERLRGHAELVDIALDLIDRAEMPLLDEPGKAARAGLRELKKAWPRLIHDFSAAEREINARGAIASPSTVPVLVAWDGSTFRVAEA